MLLRVLLLLSLVSLTAAAQTSVYALTHSGMLLDGDDTPITSATEAMTFRLVNTDATTAGEQVLWSATCNVAIRAGYYAVALGDGCGSALNATILPADTDRWLEISLRGITLAPRHRVGRIPAAELARRALDSDKLEGHPASYFATSTHVHATANGSTSGFLSASDWSVFNGKLSAESDPKIGALANGKWCTSNGSQITCTSADPTPAAGGQANTGIASPVACSPATTGYLWYDPSGPSVKVCNGGLYVALGAVPPLPVAPGTSTLSSTASGLNVSWATVANAISYEVGYQAGTTLDGTATIVPVVSGTSAPLDGLTSGTTYAVAVRSIAGSYTSAWSNVATGKTSSSLYAVVQPSAYFASTKLLLDAGDSASYSSGQTWGDRSGGNSHFVLGDTTATAANDPTFNGVAGRLSAGDFFSFDGNDYFGYSSGTSAAWMNAIGTTNAKAAWAGWYYHPVGATRIFFFNNADFSPNGPILVELTATKEYRIASGGVINVVRQAVDTTTLDGRWHFFAGVADQAGTTQLYWDGAILGTDTGGYTSGSVAGQPFTIGARSDNRANEANPAGTRLAMLGIWQGTTGLPAISDLAQIYAATKQRFGQ